MMKSRNFRTWWASAAVFIVIVMAAGGVFGAEDRVSQLGTVSMYVLPDQEKGGTAIDFDNAIPMPMPQATIKPPWPATATAPVQFPGPPGYSPGSPGNAKVSATAAGTTVASSVEGSTESANIGGRGEYGTSNLPYTTSRVDMGNNNAFSKVYPYRAAGKLYFVDGTTTYQCTASLIKNGIIVTAAHCVAKFGSSAYYKNFEYIPALWGKTKPYGTWGTVAVYALTSYLDGTDTCAQKGVVCQNDIAVLVAKPKNGRYPGKTTGWFGYQWNGWGFTTLENNKVALINQLGYPSSHDNGLKMQRTDSMGHVDATNANNTLWGSRLTGGASGGPNLLNLGVLADLSEGITVGTDATMNVVVGVSSWATVDDQTPKLTGASPFLSTNIVELVNTACAAYPKACKD
jgi:V8-like Glu-specific endopeptidase